MPTIRTRKTKGGEVRYEVQVRLKGQPAEVATFRKLAEAKRWAADTESAIRNKRHFGRSLADRHTAAEAIDRYVAEHAPRLTDSGRPSRLLTLAFWRERIGWRKLGELTPDLLSRVLAELESGGRAGATVNRYAAALRRVFSIAEREWGWIERNPMRNVTRRPEPPGRVRYLSDGERERLLAACKASRTRELYPLVLLALSTGGRFGELVGLRWQDVSFDRASIVFRRTKNKDRRGVPMTSSARSALEILGPKESGPIFAGRDFRTAWDNALERAKVEDFRFHDLRHSCASYLAMSGASLMELSEILGHKTLAMVRRYAHLSSLHLREVAGRMEAKFLTPNAPGDPPASD